MVQQRHGSGGMSDPSASGRLMLAFATGACCVSALALAFSLGRHWPLGVSEGPEAGVPSLSEVRQRGAIPYSELAIDRGTQPDNTTRAPAMETKAGAQSATRPQGDRTR